jgi:hypothetical protein
LVWRCDLVSSSAPELAARSGRPIKFTSVSMAPSADIRVKLAREPRLRRMPPQDAGTLPVSQAFSDVWESVHDQQITLDGY